ncbi:MAG: asparagine synthase-related protein [Pleurocapsa sp.]
MISDVFAIINWSKSRTLPELVQNLAQDGVFADGYSAQIELDKPEICLGTVSKADGKDSHWHYESRDIVLHGDICGGFKPDSSWENAEFPQLSDRIFNGVYNLLVWCEHTKSLLVTSDYLSTKSLYYWQQDETVVISSNLKAFRSLPFIPQKLNPQVLAATLALSHPLTDDTLIAGVKILPANCATVFRREKIEFISRPARSNKVDFTSTEAGLINRLNGLMEQSLQTWLGDAPHSLIALSGGLDSRILLGYLQRSEKQITAATWGEPESDDFKLGVELAQTTNTEYITYNITGDSAIAESDLKFPAWRTESFSVNNVPFYWKGWIDLLQTQNLPVIHGFLGGPLGGGRLTKWGISQDYFGQEANNKVLAQLNDWGMNATPNILLEFATPEFKPYLTRGIAQDLTNAFEGIEQSYVYQRLMCLDFYYRQRRYLGNAISKIFGIFLPTKLPFYTQENLDFVLQLPLPLILGRKIFRKILLAEFPDLAGFQEADKGKLPIYNNPWKKYRDRLIENRYVWYLFPQLKPRNSALVFNSLLNKHAPIFIKTIEDSGNVLNNYIDVEKVIKKLKLGSIDPRERAEIMRLFNICTFINQYFN